jgi:hypothetical protein
MSTVSAIPIGPIFLPLLCRVLDVYGITTFGTMYYSQPPVEYTFVITPS